jgi:hypothetical protein
MRTFVATPVRPRGEVMRMDGAAGCAAMPPLSAEMARTSAAATRPVRQLTKDAHLIGRPKGKFRARETAPFAEKTPVNCLIGLPGRPDFWL